MPNFDNKVLHELTNACYVVSLWTWSENICRYVSENSRSTRVSQCRKTGIVEESKICQVGCHTPLHISGYWDHGCRRHRSTSFPPWATSRRRIMGSSYIPQPSTMDSRGCAEGEYSHSTGQHPAQLLWPSIHQITFQFLHEHTNANCYGPGTKTAVVYKATHTHHFISVTMQTIIVLTQKHKLSSLKPHPG